MSSENTFDANPALQEKTENISETRSDNGSDQQVNRNGMGEAFVNKVFS